MNAWLFPRIDRPIRTLHYSHLSLKTKTNIVNEILAVKGPGIAVFWNFVITFAFYNSHFIVLLDSAIRMSAFDSLVYDDWRMIIRDGVIWQTTP